MIYLDLKKKLVTIEQTNIHSSLTSHFSQD